jgi:hypothetical protein
MHSSCVPLIHCEQFAACFMLIACLAYSSILKMEAVCSSEMSVNLCQTTWHYIPEGSSLHTVNKLLDFCVMRLEGHAKFCPPETSPMNDTSISVM